MTMDFTRAAARVRSLIAARKPQELSKSGLTDDALRDNIIAESAARTERFKAATRNPPFVEYETTETDEQGNETKTQHTYNWTTFPELLRDVARANFSLDEPELRRADDVRLSHRLNREILAETLISDGFMESRPYTRNNELESLFGAMAMRKSLEESAKTRLSEHIARSEEAAEIEQEMRDAQQMMDDLRNRARSEIDAAGQVADKTKREIKGVAKQRQTASELLAKLDHEHRTSSVVADASAAARDAAQAGAEAVEALHSIPGIGGGEAHNLTPDQQIALAEKWSENTDLKKIAAMIGRLYRDMRFKREARTKNVPIEPVGITTGRDFSRMLPHEVARAFSANPLIKTTFIKDFAEHAVLQYDMSGRMPAGRGPIICVTDGSGSMQGEKFIWASSVALCLLTIAQREKREFAGIEFGSERQMKEWFFPKGVPADPNVVLDYASHFFGGGTSIVTGMTAALRIMRDVPAFKSADIVLISDGQDHFREDDNTIKHALNDLGVRIHGISILCPNNAYCSQMCEYVVDVQDLAGSNDATDKLAQNIT
jgi:uncharacterized protein with von Willebrand factor type A (vWA) domain